MKAISDVKIEKIVGVPNTTLRDWKKKDRSDYRRAAPARTDGARPAVRQPAEQ